MSWIIELGANHDESVVRFADDQILVIVVSLGVLSEDTLVHTGLLSSRSNHSIRRRMNLVYIPSSLNIVLLLCEATKEPLETELVESILD